MLPVLLSLLLVTLYLLLPLVPSLVIYKRFPNTSVRVSGPLSKLKVNASGAFAAYMVVVLLGFGMMKKVDGYIAAMVTPTWEVSAQIEFRDGAGKRIRDPHSIIRDLKVQVDPPLDQRNYPEVKMRLPLVKPDYWPTLVLHVPGFEQQSIKLDRTADFERNWLRGSMALKQTVIFAPIPVVTDEPYRGDQPPLQPLGNGS